MSSKQILVIDDAPDIQAIFRYCLTDIGNWQVFCADSGSEGLTLASDIRPDAILLDLMMRGMDGLTVLQHLRDREMTCDIPVILISTKLQLCRLQLQDHLKVAGMLPKPFDPVGVIHQIETILGWDRTQSQKC